MAQPSRIDLAFSKWTSPQADKRAGLVCFTTAGFPDLKASEQIINQLPKWGADIVEIGMPFSDASADGGVIRDASKISIEQGINIQKIFGLAKSFRKANPDTPAILMGYYNPIFHYGSKKFVEDAITNGVDGLIVVDLPPEEEEELTRYMGDDLCLIHLITPTTDAKRLKMIAKNAKGFYYYVSVTGTTGASVPELAEVAEHLATLELSLPVVIGFGISEAQQVRDFSSLGQAVVIGSALIRTIMQSTEESSKETQKGQDTSKIEARLQSQIAAYKKALED